MIEDFIDEKKRKKKRNIGIHKKIQILRNCKKIVNSIDNIGAVSL